MNQNIAVWLWLSCWLMTACAREAIDPPSTEQQELTHDTWTWIPVQGAKCGDGSATGIAINPHAGADQLTIYLQGGGSCDTAEQCGTPTDPPLVWHLDGYDAETFETDMMAGRPPAEYQVFDRGDAANPFARDNFVFIPYCTGDVHTGSNIQHYRDDLVVHHVGFDNVSLDLPVIHALFPAATRLVVAGSSAGGFGATFNFLRLRARWPEARAYLIDDAGQVLPGPGARAFYTEQDAVWHNFANVAPDCSECFAQDGGPHRIYARLAEQADFRGSLLSSTHDRFMTFRYGMPPSNQDNAGCASGGTCEFESRLRELHEENAEAGPGRMHTFVPDGDQHGFLPSRFDVVAAGVPLKQFLDDQVSDNATWSSVIEPAW